MQQLHDNQLLIKLRGKFTVNKLKYSKENLHILIVLQETKI